MTGFSIKHRLVRSLAIALLALYGLGALGIFSFVSATAWRQFDRALQNELRDFMAETRIGADGRVHAEFHEMDLPQFRHGGGTCSYQLWDEAKRTLLKSASMPAERDLPLPSLELDEVAIVSAALPGGVRGRMAAVFMPVRGEPGEEAPGGDPSRSGARVYLSVAHPDGEVRGMLAKLAGGLVASGVLLTLCGAITVRAVVDRSCRPLQRFASIAAALDPANLDDRLPESEAPEEVRPFLVQINRMLDRVEAGLERERRFSTSVAHELRTPVSEVRNLMEVALTACDDPALREEPAEVYRNGAEIAKRMGRLVESLSRLLRGKVDPRISPETIAGRDIETALTDAVAGHRAEAKSRGVEFEVRAEGAEGVEVAADPVLVRAIFDNLASNAARYAPEDGRVAVASRVAGERWFEVEMANGKGDLDETDVALMAEPFWRKDASRTDRGRFGLGLSLASCYAAHMAGDLTLEIRGDQFVARLRLALAPRRAAAGAPEHRRRAVAAK